MDFMVLSLGALLGAGIGILITRTSASELKQEAPRAFARSRMSKWKEVLERPFWGAAQLLTIESLTILLLILVIFSIIVGVFGQYFGNGSSASSTLLLGALIGFIAAPWLWLHFSKGGEPGNASPKSQSGKPKPDKEHSKENGDFARYRFITVVLGVLLLFYILHPHLRDWLSRTQGFTGWGFAVTLADRDSQSASTFSLGGVDVAGHSSLGDQFIQSLRNASTVGGKEGLSGNLWHSIEGNLLKFEDLPVIMRDRAFTAFLLHGGASAVPQQTRLGNYIVAAEIQGGRTYTQDEIRDVHFVESVSSIMRCLSDYAFIVKDYRLLLVGVSPFLESMLITTRDSIITNINAWQKHFDTEATELIKRAERILNAVGEYTGGGDRQTCEGRPAITPPFDPSAWFSAPTGTTPYPIIVFAHLMAAVDSAETGVVTISNWLGRQRPKFSDLTSSDVRRSWFIIRARTDAILLAGLIGRSAPSAANIRHFQRQTTDQLSTLLRVQHPEQWRLFCRRVSELGPTLHGGLGQRIGFVYATQRGHVFELTGFRLPSVSASEHEFEKDILRLSAELPADIEEARAIVASAPHCFERVPGFQKESNNWMGYFHLNLAQLLAARIPFAPVESRAELARQANDELELARARLRQEASPASSDGGRILRAPDFWEQQRRRLTHLQEFVNSAAPRR